MDKAGYCITDESFEKIGECSDLIKSAGILKLSKDDCSNGYINLVLAFILLITLVELSNEYKKLG